MADAKAALDPGTAGPPLLRLTPAPTARRAWLADLVGHREVLVALARKDFQTRYKRAGFGVLWAVALPLVQAAVLAIVFSRVARFPIDGTDVGLGAYVLAGMLAYSYFAASLSAATTAIVDGAALAERVWFPRAVLVIVPCAANVVGFAVSTVVGILLCPLVGGTLSLRTLLVIPGAALLAGFVVALGEVLAALYVYFRDVRFIVQAVMLVWIYVTPVIYPRAALGRYEGLVDFNPLTGPISLYHAAFGVEGDPVFRPALVTLACTVVLGLLMVEAHRRHDRRFIDLL